MSAAAVITGTWAAVTTTQAAAGKMTRSAGRLDQAAESLKSELRVLKAHSQRSSPGQNLAAPHNPPTVVLVDDDGVMARAAMRNLVRAGFKVRHAVDGPTACGMMAEAAPDVLVCDLFLGPGCSGVSVAREARFRNPNTRVVLWSGVLQDPELEDARRKTGAHSVLSKQEGIAALVDLLCQLLEVRRASK